VPWVKFHVDSVKLPRHTPNPSNPTQKAVVGSLVSHVALFLWYDLVLTRHPLLTPSHGSRDGRKRTVQHDYGRRIRIARLLGYCNSDLVDDIDIRKSTTGVMFFLRNCLVSWQSLKQRFVALSSYEVDYTAATIVVTQAIWMARLLGEHLGRESEVVTLARNLVFHERSKHIGLSTTSL
jgi:hypothetical protein